MTEEENASQGYDFRAVETKWQKYWLDNRTFKTTEDPKKQKYYILDMFPYPSGNGLHVGHPEGYTATDILARYKRMKGFNVLHPMGWDAFGLPAEQYAITTGTHPATTTEKNINRFRQQIQSIGLSYDWDREVNTTDPKYYKWTQWIFMQLYKKGLAYQSQEAVNWCPALGTVLANEEVIDGRSERGNHPVEKRPIRQWVLKITAYAERLLNDLDDVDWPESVKEMQKNWIGKSQGAQIRFQVSGSPHSFQVYSTRPDTLFGATFCVVAPEHPVLSNIIADDHRSDVDAYVQDAVNRTDLDRTSLAKDKTGCFTGAYAINPVNQEKLPIYVADYVLMSYGEGAIMAVPGHDERDHEFAKKYQLKIIRVLEGGTQDIADEAYLGDGTIVNSGFLDGLRKAEAIEKICDWLEKNNHGKRQVNYKLRDWLFSRQRYWGEPFPIVHDKDGNVELLDEQDLPVVLPELVDFKPTGSTDGPLALAGAWLHQERHGKQVIRETNTMPQWAGSCWYYLRFIDPHNENEPWDKAKERYWMPVDLYVGGVEHAVLHLLYARFWHKVLYDCGYVSTKEPFQRLVNQGMILGENGEKMSKSRGNVVNPDDVISEHGADALRLYEMFMGPLEATKPWQTKGIGGVSRFLKRVWRLFVDDQGSLTPRVQQQTPEGLKKALHKTMKKVSEDTENLRFNTGIAAMMEFLNLAYKEPGFHMQDAKDFVLTLSPYAPHLAEEIWEKLGHTTTLAYHPWPRFDPDLVIEDLITMSIQVNGKMRGTIRVAKNGNKDEALDLAKKQEGVKRHLDEKTILKEIFVPNKIINFVVKP